MIGGVAGGIAEHLGVDPVLIRLSFVALAFAGIGFALYLIGWIVIPEDAGEATATAEPAREDSAMAARFLFGSLLVAVGSLMLVDRIFPIGRFIWPLALIILGIGVFAYGSKR